MASVFLKPQQLNSGKTLVPVTHMRHKKPKAIVAILITKQSRYQFIFPLNWAAFPLLLFQTLKNQLWHIDDCFNFKMITEAMIFTSSAEKTPLSGDNLTQQTICTRGFTTPICVRSTITTCSKQKLSYLQRNLNKQDSKKQEGPKKSQRALNCILLGYRCVQQRTDKLFKPLNSLRISQN